MWREREKMIPQERMRRRNSVDCRYVLDIPSKKEEGTRDIAIQIDVTIFSYPFYLPSLYSYQQLSTAKLRLLKVDDNSRSAHP